MDFLLGVQLHFTINHAKINISMRSQICYNTKYRKKRMRVLIKPVNQFNLPHCRGGGKVETMHIEIRPFTPALADDYFDFFDHRAFTDHEEWSCCYCTWFHMNKEDEKRIEEEISADGGKDAVHRILKNYAARLVSDTTLRGYLAYADGVPIGWCNANDKVAFHRFDLDAEINDCIRGTGSGATMAVVCFTVAPGFRGRGVATALLGRVCEDAKRTAMPPSRDMPAFATGTSRLILPGRSGCMKGGVAQAARKDNVVIMRKS